MAVASTRIQQICALTGYLVIILFLAGFVLAGFISPPSPEASAAEIARMFDADRDAIRIGLVITMWATGLLVPWGAGLYVQLRRAAGRSSPLPQVVLVSMALFSLEFIYLVFFWQVAAVREDTSPEIIRTLNDMGWLPFVGLTATAVLLSLALGLAILSDDRAKPVFPRWAGYFNVWAATLFTPGTLCVFFKDGPFAYDGVIAWYLPVTVFTVWMIVNTVLLQRAIAAQRDEAPATAVHGEAVDVAALAREVARLRQELDRSTASS